MKIPLNILPEHTIQQYNMQEHAKNGFVYLEIWKAIYDLPQVGILADKQLRKFLKPARYYEVVHTSDLTTSKIIWNSVLSTEGARFMGIDIKNVYLGTPLSWFEYMKMPLNVLPEHTIQQYNMREHVNNGFFYFEIQKAIHGLPQADISAN